MPTLNNIVESATTHFSIHPSPILQNALGNDRDFLLFKELKVFHWFYVPSTQEFLVLHGSDVIHSGKEENAFLRLVHPEDHDKLRQRFTGSQEIENQMDLRIFAKMNYCNFHLWWKCFESDGEIVYRGFAKNQEKEAVILNELVSSKKELDLALDGANLGLWEFSIETGKLDLDIRCQTMFRADRVVEIADFLSLFDTVNRANLVASFSKAINDKSEFELEVEQHKPQLRNIKFSGSVLTDSFGRVLKILGTCLDITSYRTLEKQLRLQAQMHRRTNELAGFGAWEYYQLEDRLNIDKKFAEILGLGIERMNVTFDQFANNLDREVHKNLEAFFKSKLRENDAIRFRVRTGNSTKFFQLVATSNADLKRNVISGVLQDITSTMINRQKEYQRVLNVQEKERQRIAHDIHDGFGQTLTAANMYLSSISDKSFTDDRDKENWVRGKDLLKKSINEARLISHNLSPQSIDKFGLEEGLKVMLKDMQVLGEFGVNIQMRSNIGNQRFSKDVEIGAYRLLQEIINNCLKHSGAENLEIVLFIDNNSLNISTVDDGIGFDTKKTQREGLGLEGLKNRVESLHGDIRCSAKPKEGVNYAIKIPL